MPVKIDYWSNKKYEWLIYFHEIVLGVFAKQNRCDFLILMRRLVVGPCL